MESRPIHPKHLVWSVLAVAVLGVSVFLWGAEYKCSLYHAHPEKHARIATAKLLSEEERPMVVHGVSQTRPPLRQVEFLAFGTLAARISEMLSTGPDRTFPAGGNQPVARRIPGLIHFAFRPPPGFAA